MGCHTWFVKHLPKTFEEMTKDAIAICEAMVVYLTEFDEQNVLVDDICVDRFRLGIGYYEAIKTHIERGLVNHSIHELYYEIPEGCSVPDLDYSYSHTKKQLYYDDGNMPHDIFRTKDTEEELFSLKETYNFLTKMGIKLDGAQIYALEQFWHDNPNGMIYFC